MTLAADDLVERRRLKRRIAFWRIAAVLAVVALIAMAGRGSGGGGGFTSALPHVARLRIEGTILDDRRQSEMLRKLADSNSAAAVIVHVDSLGGTTAGGEMLYEGLRRIAQRKPVVAVFGTTATSAGYMAGIAADHIVARGNTITGSVGVIIQWPEISGALDKLGVRFNEIKSGPAKAEPSPFKPLTEEGRRVAEEMIAESKDWFIGLVRSRRSALTEAQLGDIGSGRIYSGRQALALGLIDGLGDERDAVAWLVSRRNVAPELTILDWKPAEDNPLRLLGMESAGHSLLRGLAAAIGLPLPIAATGLLSVAPFGG